MDEEKKKHHPFIHALHIKSSHMHVWWSYNDVPIMPPNSPSSAPIILCQRRCVFHKLMYHCFLTRSFTFYFLLFYSRHFFYSQLDCNVLHFLGRTWRSKRVGVHIGHHKDIPTSYTSWYKGFVEKFCQRKMYKNKNNSIYI